MAEELDDEMLEFEKRYGRKNESGNGDNGYYEGNGNEGQVRKVVIILASLAAVLALVLAYVWISNMRLVKELNSEKDDLTSELIALQTDYETISTNNVALNDSLTVEKEKVDQLIERLQKTEATNRTKIRQYEKELGTLRSIMKSYIKQIDSLNTLNIALRSEATEARKEAAQSKQKYDDLVGKAEKYAAQASAGAVLKGRGVSLTAINASNRETDRSSRANKLKACLSLIENAIAEKGDRMVYIKVFAPDGSLLAGDQQTAFTCNGEEMMASASRVVDYQGEEIEVCVYFTRAADSRFQKGVYKVEVYTSETMLGSADLLLR